MNQDIDRELSSLYRAGAREEPPVVLDRRIMRAARAVRAVRPVSVWGRLRESLIRWQWGLSVAAVLVLCVSLVLVVEDHPDMKIDGGAPPVEAPAPPRSPDAIAQARAPVQPTGEVSPTRRDAADEVATATPDGAPSVRGVRERPAGDVSAADAGPPAGASAGRAVAAAEPAAPARVAATEATTAERPPASVPDLPTPSVPAVPPRAAVAPSPEVARAAEDAARSGAGVDAFVVRGAQRAQPGDSRARTEEGPEAWLARLEQWLRAGREEDVIAELKRFRQRYPGHPLTEALRRFSPPATTDAAGSADPATQPGDPRNK